MSFPLPDLPGLDTRALLKNAIREILEHEDYDRFIDNFSSEFAGMNAESNDDEAVEEASRMGRLLGRAIWNATPLPSHDWRPRPLPLPGRNDACLCGSGRKFKQCCAKIPSPPALPPDAIWTLVLAECTAGQVRHLLAKKRVSPYTVSGAALYMIESGDSADAYDLLAPFFYSANGDLPEQPGDDLIELLGPLTLAQVDLDLDGERDALLEHCTTVGSAAFRAEAWLARSMIRSDQDWDVAWHALGQARALAPNSPAVARRELLMLMDQGRADEARTRAAALLDQHRRSADEDTLALLEDMADDPALTMLGMEIPDEGVPIDRLQKVVQAIASRPLPTDARWFRPEVMVLDGPDAGQLRDHLEDMLRAQGIPDSDIARELDALADKLQDAARNAAGGGEDASDAALAARQGTIDVGHAASVEAAWHRVFPGLKPMLTMSMPETDDNPWVRADAWLGFLDREPLAGDSLDILDDLSMAILAVTDEASSRWTDRLLRGPLLERAYRIVDQAMRAAPEGSLLPWGYPGNRTCLRLVAEWVTCLRRDRENDRASAVAERLLSWNPNDNHGVREQLVVDYLRAGATERVLDLCERYPDDDGAYLAYSRALALFMRGERAAADQALVEARGVNEFVAQAIQRALDRAGTPPLRFANAEDEDLAGEAEDYADDAAAVWLAAPGALDWLVQSASRRARRPHPRAGASRRR